MYDVNLENEDTDYESGDEFHVDAVVGLHLGNYAVGVGGFYYKQVTDDEQDGDKVAPDGNKGQSIGWGPEVSGQFGPLNVSLMYQNETDTENRPEGDRFWLKLVCPL
jgi:hypothetical protein